MPAASIRSRSTSTTRSVASGGSQDISQYMHDDSIPVDITPPSLEGVGFGFEWAADHVFEIVTFYINVGEDTRDRDGHRAGDPVVVNRIASELLRLLPVWKLNWADDDRDTVDEVSRQLRIQITALSRTLLFIARQLPHGTHEHVLMAVLYHGLCQLPPNSYMPLHFSLSPDLCQQALHWLTSIPADLRAPDPSDPDPHPPSNLILHPHHPTNSIWLFDQYLTNIEYANLIGFYAHLYRLNPYQNTLLGLTVQVSIEKALCYSHFPAVANLVLPGAAAWFFYAYTGPARPETFLKGWYDIFVPPAANGRQSPSGPRYAGMASEEARWWAFFKDKFREARDRTDLSPLARDYADSAVHRMGWLDGSWGDKVGFWQGLRKKVGSNNVADEKRNASPGRGSMDARRRETRL